MRRLPNEGVVERPVPPRFTANVPVVSDNAMPSDDVAKARKVLFAPPINREELAMEFRPVPPMLTARVDEETNDVPLK